MDKYMLSSTAELTPSKGTTQTYIVVWEHCITELELLQQFHVPELGLEMSYYKMLAEIIRYPTRHIIT